MHVTSHDNVGDAGDYDDCNNEYDDYDREGDEPQLNVTETVQITNAHGQLSRCVSGFIGTVFVLGRETEWEGGKESSC